MGRVLCGPSWFWAELSCTPLTYMGGGGAPVNDPSEGPM